MRTGTGQTLPVGTVFRCTEGNRWDIRQLPEPAGWFYIGSRHHRYPAFFGAPMSTGMISCNSQSLPVGIIGPQITANASIVASSNEVYKQGSRYCRGRYWEPAPSIPGIFRSTNEYRHDILQQPEPAGGYNRTTNNCECINCSILVFLDCFLSVI